MRRNHPGALKDCRYLPNGACDLHLNRSAAVVRTPGMDGQGRPGVPVASSAVADQALLVELTEVFDRLYDTCLRVAARTVRDPSLAEDVVQEAFLAAWKHAPPRFDPARGPLESWLMTLTRYKAVDAVRNAEHLRRVRRSEEAEPRRMGSRELPEEIVLRARDAQELRRGIKALPAGQQRVLLATYWEGLSQAQIARRDGTPLGTVKTRTAAGLNRLRALMASEPA